MKCFASMKCKWVVALQLLVQVLVLLSRESEAGFLPPKIHLKIVNDLDGGIPLTVHCKSKDNDLGIHVINHHGTYEFDFRVNYFRTTLFFCEMSWYGYLEYIDIYDAVRDRNQCTDCDWSIKQKEPCRTNAETKAVTCIPWNNKPHH